MPGRNPPGGRPARDNHFQLIRLLAATTIIVSHGHCIVLGGAVHEPLHALFGRSIGMVALDVFFVVSGFVVTGSLLARPRPLEFLLRMVLRLWPGLVVMLLVTVTACGLLFARPIGAFATGPAVAEYLLGNLFPLRGMRYELPGLFPDNPIPGVLNASLWTLPKQVKLYLLAVGIFAVVSPLMGSRRLAGWKTTTGMVLWIACMAPAYVDKSWFLGFSLSPMPWLFATGAALQLHRKGLVSGRMLLAGTCSGIAVGAMAGSWGDALYLGSIPHAIVGLAHARIPWLSAWNRRGDYSYGLYLYGFPIQQIVLALWPRLDLGFSILATFAIASAAAVASWHLVEAPAMRWREWIPSGALTGSVRDLLAVFQTRGNRPPG